MPAEIKKREKYLGPIRKLDKSAILSHKIKEVSVKTREAVMRNERDDTGGQNNSRYCNAWLLMKDKVYNGKSGKVYDSATGTYRIYAADVYTLHTLAKGPSDIDLPFVPFN